ncbi:type II secretion system F family protein [Phosphitispora sp. TUW77]|uniref:type II secretion system F family protein n=1 Tax=Phosphitispora sp. TUW77 TaxID=3152361 RepID=UPI003AB750FC
MFAGDNIILLLPPLLTLSWVCLVYYLFILNSNKLNINRKLNHLMGYHKVSTYVGTTGWNITSREFWGIVIFAVGSGLLLSALFKNPLIILAGILAGYYLPRLMIHRYRKRRQAALLTSIPDFGRILTARLVDHHSIVKAFEIIQNDVTEPVKTLAADFLKDTGVGMGIPQALENLKARVALRKFDILAETLLIAHYEGYSSEALLAMEKAVEAIENDIKAVDMLEITSAKKKKELVYIVLASWAFPVILSFMNTGNVNVYLDTIPGKILMFSYLVSTLFVLIKGEEYLSLSLEEL